VFPDPRLQSKKARKKALEGLGQSLPLPDLGANHPRQINPRADAPPLARARQTS